MAQYSECASLASVYLEDSWVLSVDAMPTTLELLVDFVLKESHPAYASPAPGEQYCYKKGRLVFSSLVELHWVDQGRRPAVDASGELDYGSFDVAQFEGQAWTLIGDFGRISFLSQAPPSIEWQF
ncbi:hypothetical protein [Pseudarthrobacter sp. NamE5]|uniref:hypothetical protein n=1 Tax=Pseudarthrobacter sp. NamE5 TaxID=2576839 RepID=UPI00110B45CE|nr:hypothetical protein [Pseudarthrobacter sp. NamE5]TLM80818.1 hypothetical protein FDW84_18375 [Pseudarthrobacter sp. NamE5]